MCSPFLPSHARAKSAKRIRNAKRSLVSSSPLKKLVVETLAEIRAKNLVMGQVRMLRRGEPPPKAATNKLQNQSAGPSPDAPAASTDPNREIPATSKDSNREKRTMSTNPNQGIPSSSVNPKLETPTSPTESNRKTPASSTNPNREIPATSTNPNREIPSSPTSWNREIPNPSGGPSQEKPTCSTDPNRRMPVSCTGPKWRKLYVGPNQERPNNFAGQVTSISPSPKALPLPGFLMKTSICL